MNQPIPPGSGKTKPYKTCSICGNPYVGYGCNARPVNNGRCCNVCDRTVVIPARIKRMNQGLPPYEGGVDEEVVKAITEALLRGEDVPGITRKSDVENN